MVTAVYLSSKDDQTVASELQTPSFMAMVQANTNKSVKDKDFLLQTKTQLINDISKGLKTGNLNTGGNSFDHLVFDFSANEDAQAIASEIVSFYANPDYTVVKNQGGGKIQNKAVKGTREVLYDLHIAQDGTAHLHILKSHWSIDGSRINPATTCKDTYVIKAEEYNLNQHLENTLGISNVVSSFVSGGSPNSTYTNPKASPQTKNVITQAVQADTIEEFQEILATAQNASVSQNIVSNTITSIDKELAELKEKANVLFEMRKLAEGIKLVEQNNEILERNNKVLTDINTKVKEENIVVIAEKEKIKSEFEQAADNFVNEKASLNNDILNLNETLSSKVEEIKELEELNTQAQEEIASKEIEVNDLNSKVSNLNEVITAKDKQITIQITQIERQEIALKSIEETNKKLAENNEKLLERMQAIEQQLKDEKEQSAKKLAEQQKQFDDRIKLVEDSNTKLKEQNDIILKENTVFKELTEMAIAKYKQATAIIKSLGAKLNTATDKKVVATAVKQATDFDKAVKQVDSEKKDIEDKMAAVRALFAKGKADAQKPDNNDDGATSKVKPK